MKHENLIICKWNFNLGENVIEFQIVTSIPSHLPNMKEIWKEMWTVGR